MRSFNVPDLKAENTASVQSLSARISGIKSDLSLVGLGQASELCAQEEGYIGFGGLNKNLIISVINILSSQDLGYWARTSTQLF